jgi:hypothetical protein
MLRPMMWPPKQEKLPPALASISAGAPPENALNCFASVSASNTFFALALIVTS